MSLKKEFITDTSLIINEDFTTNGSTDVSLENIRQLVTVKDITQLKAVSRIDAACFGLNHDIRSELWKLLCDVHCKPGRKLVADSKIFQNIVNTCGSIQNDSGFEDKNSSATDQMPQSPRKLPGFVDLTACRHFHLNSLGQKLIDRILWEIARDHPEIMFAPLMYPLASLFLHYMSPEDTLAALLVMIEANKTKAHPLIPISKSQISKDAFVLTKLTNKFGSIISILLPSKRNRLFQSQRHKLSTNKEIDECFHDWLKWIFVGLPFQHLVRVIDCYLVEGFKFFFRIGLSLLFLYSRSSPASNMTLDSMIIFCENIPSSPQQLIEFAVSLPRFSADKVMKQYEKAELELRQFPSISGAYIPQSSPCLARRSDIIRKEDPVTISTRSAPRDLNSDALDWYLLDTLWEWLPDRIAIKEPVIVFSTNNDGSSLRTFFDKTSPHEPTVLLIKTTNNEIFGAYCSASWAGRLSRDVPGTFFGNGETFLFTLQPKAARYPWVGEGTGETRGKRSTQLFMSSNNKCLIIGSGGGSGLWLDEQLTQGKSEPCLTFDNKPLSANGDFVCALIEVIAFD